MYERVLIPTDGSDAADPAVERAVDLAETYDAELHALNVVDTASLTAEVNTAQVIDDLEEQGAAAVEAVAERANAAGIRAVTTEVVHGVPHKQILEYAADNDIDVLVMGTHGRSGLEHVLLGSVTEKVVRKSPVPVLTVRAAGEDE